MMAPERRESSELTEDDVEGGPTHEEGSISGALRPVLDGFELFKSKQDADDLVARAICDSAAIRIWVGNIGAFHPSDDRRSAAFKLRSAPAVSKRNKELLCEIDTDNRELLSLLQGERVDASQQTGEEDLDEEDWLCWKRQNNRSQNPKRLPRVWLTMSQAYSEFLFCCGEPLRETDTPELRRPFNHRCSLLWLSMTFAMWQRSSQRLSTTPSPRNGLVVLSLTAADFCDMLRTTTPS